MKPDKISTKDTGSGVTRGLSHGGQSLAEGDPLVTVEGTTSQNSEKGFKK